MIRSLWFMVQVGVFAALVMWVAARPGTIQIEWLSYTLTVQVGLALVALIILIAACVLLYQVYSFIVNFPKTWQRYQSFKAQEKGFKALSVGLTAVAAGDARTATRQAQRADKYLKGEPGLSLLLQAQAARMNGQQDKAQALLLKLMSDKDAGFLGARGALQRALDEGDMQEAISIADQALQKHGKHPFLLQIAYQLALSQGQWREALKHLHKLERYDVFDRHKTASDRGALMVAMADSRQTDKAKVSDLKKALSYRPFFIPAVQGLAAVYKAQKKIGDAKKLVQQAWRFYPHPLLPKIWGDIMPPKKADKVMGRMKWFEDLASIRKNCAETSLMLAVTAMEEALWGEAREHFSKAQALGLQSVRLYTAMAELERKQGGNEAAAQDWLAKARDAEPEEAWVCGETGLVYQEWFAKAAPHESFNTIDWQVPPSTISNALPVMQSGEGLLGLLKP